MRTVLLKEMSTSKELVELSQLYTNITEKKETDKDKEDAKKEGELEKVLTNLKNNKKDDKEEIKGPNVTGVVRNKNTGEIIRVDRDKNNLSKTDKEDLKKSVKTYHATDRSGRDFDDPGADSDVRGGSKERKPITQDIKGSDGKVVGKKTTHPASPDYQKTFENPKKVDTSKLPSELTKGKEKEIAKANKPEVKVEPVKTKITARSQMRQRNIDRFGADKVNALMDKQKAFKSMQAKSMMPGAKPGAAKAEFAKNFPTSNVAKDLKKSKRVTQVMDLESYDPSLNEGEMLVKGVAKPKYDGEVLVKKGVAKPKYDGEVLTGSVIMTKAQAEKLNKQISQRNKTKTEDFDAFDIVLGYLVESEQVDSMDEALYIMMEMDAATIQGIVRDFEILSEEAADKEKDDRLVKYGIGHDGSDRKAGSGGSSDSKRPKGKTNLQKETEKKHGKGKSPLDVAKANIVAKYGKGAIAPSKKKKK